MTSGETSDWGRFPSDVLDRLRQREWHDSGRLSARLLGERPFPIRVNLKPPSGGQAIDDLSRFRRWVEEWRRFAEPDLVVWEHRRLRRLEEHILPVALAVESVHSLARVLGPAALARLDTWEPRLAPLLALASEERGPALYRTLVQRLARVEGLPLVDVRLLAKVIPQLVPGMGGGAYLRALPLDGVDTKFVEQQQGLIVDLLDALHDGAVSAAGGLLAWLDCEASPSGWVVVRPLCSDTRSALAELSILQLPMQSLGTQALPARRILIVENLQSGLALPTLPDTIAVIGCGRNVAWLSAPWLATREVGYWGDIDTWGLQILAEARGHCSHVVALMMDMATLEKHRERLVDEPRSCQCPGDRLTPAERALLEALQSADGGYRRLEQERLSSGWMREQLSAWLGTDME